MNGPLLNNNDLGLTLGLALGSIAQCCACPLGECSSAPLPQRAAVPAVMPMWLGAYAAQHTVKLVQLYLASDRSSKSWSSVMHL